MINGAQIKAARKLLGWSVEKLAAATRRSATAIRYAEAQQHRTVDATSKAAQQVFETAGIEFTDNGVTVKFRSSAG